MRTNLKVLFLIKGWEINEEQMGTFLECEVCERNDCQFKHCSDSLFGFIFCTSISNTSQDQITEHFTTSQESFLLQPYCQIIQHQMNFSFQHLQLEITIQASHNQLMTRSKCQVI